MTKAQDTEHSPETLLMSALRDLKRQMYYSDTVDIVEKCSPEVRTAFVTKRMALCGVISRLQTLPETTLRRRLEEQGEDLIAGVREVAESLKTQEKEAQWPQEIGRVLSSVSKILPAA